MAGDGGGYDLVAFGEAMVRLCPPGFGRVEAATMLEMLPGGAELNTAVGVARLDAIRHGFHFGLLFALARIALAQLLCGPRFIVFVGFHGSAPGVVLQRLEGGCQA